MGRSPFPPIADYGFLSDCETTAHLAPDGNVDWLCLPPMDSPSVFGAVLDRDVGTLRLGPTGVQVPAARRYSPGTIPTDHDADHVLLRLVRCVNDEVQIRLDCGVVFDYGRVPARGSAPAPAIARQSPAAKDPIRSCGSRRT